MTHGGARIRTLGLALALAGLAAPPAGAAGEMTPRATGWVIERTGPGPAPYSAMLRLRSKRAGAHAVLFGLTGKGRERRRESAILTATFVAGTDAWVRAYGTPHATPDCVSVTCANPLFVVEHKWESDSRGYPMSSKVYVAGWDMWSSVEVTSPGWRVRPWRPSMRVVRTVDGGGSGVAVADMSRGSFERAELAGGPYGSHAFAAIPCEHGGTGRAAFTGGRRAWPLDCATRHTLESEDATGPTRWRLVGHVEGDSAHTNALVVVDWPR